MKKRILGAGLLCLDIIETSDEILFQNGGTCNNVLSALSVLGWSADILRPLYNDQVESIANRTLVALGIQTVEYKKSKFPFPRIVQSFGNKTHSFETMCPICNTKMLNLDLPSEKDIIKLGMSYNEYDVFFHDRISSGIKYLVNSSDKIIFFEPNSSRNSKNIIDHSMNCNIVKFSSSKISSTTAEIIRSNAVNSKTQIIICTDGQKGARFSYRSNDNKMSPWHQVPPFMSSDIADTSGAGDWLTAGFIDCFFRDNIEINSKLNMEFILHSLENANNLAKKASKFYGAQGVFYSDSAMDEWGKKALTRAANEMTGMLENNHICQKCFCELE